MYKTFHVSVFKVEFISLPAIGFMIGGSWKEKAIIVALPFVGISVGIDLS